MTTKTKSILTHVGIVLFFLVVSCVYFSPILNGKVLPQGDLQKSESMKAAQANYHDQTGEYTTWSPSMFSGMPGYQIYTEPQHSAFHAIRNVLNLKFMGWSNTIGVLFLYLIGFYVALLAFGVGPWLALAGALAFGLGSYNIIIIEAGHITKAWAMSMVAPILAGMVLAFRRKYVWGGILFTCALAIQIACNHIQITFYTVIGALFLGLAYFIYSIKENGFRPFLNGLGVLLIGCILAFGSNLRLLLVNQEYMKYTMRGGKSITVTPADLGNGEATNNDNTTATGLDKNYAFSWSYGIGETYTILVPGAMGGGSGEKVDTDSQFYKNFRQERAPLYWGDQPFTSGPVYFGAIIIFLFILGLVVVKGPERWWILLATILAIILSWGHNAMGFNGWLFDNLPLYNKFRTPSMALILANVTMVLMAILAVKSIFESKKNIQSRDGLKKINMALYISAGITIAILLVGMIMASGFSYSGAADAQMAQQYKDNPQLLQMLQSTLAADRENLFRADTMRSLIFVILSAGVIWLYLNDRLKKSSYLTAALTILVVVDLWGIDQRYLNKDNFTEERRIRQNPEQYDLDIDRMAAQYGDVEYRVMDMATDTYNDSKPSAFHNQIGGYSAAKLRRYQDLIDFYINQSSVFAHYQSQAMQGNPMPFDNYAVLDMLNCRYMVLPAQNGPQVIRRNSALGNAWFVKEVQIVEDDNSEILALNDFDPSKTAIVNKKYASLLDGLILDSTSSASIEMVYEDSKSPDLCKYKATCDKPSLAVFSEINYDPDWFAYIDGKPAEYVCANYVLRAMIVPAGTHEIEFRNEAPTMHKLDNWTLIFSLITLFAIAGAIWYYYKKEETK